MAITRGKCWDKLLILVIACIGCSGVCRGQTDFPSSPVFNDTGDPTLDLPLDHPLNTPAPIEQVVVSPSDFWGTGYWIIWTTNQTAPSVVYLSEDGGDTFTLSFSGKAARYSYLDYVSGLIHKVNCSGLKHSHWYHFKILLGDNEHRGTFITAPPPGAPVKLAFIGDLGTTTSSVSTIKHVLATGAQAFVLVGDFSYADGFQPRWDLWQRIMYKMVGHLPLHFCYGNHEIEQEFLPGGIKAPQGFYAADARFAGPAAASSKQVLKGGIPGNAFHSTNIGLVHLVSLNSYYIYSKYTIQWRWIQHDLSSVDRNLTSFVVVILHTPWYSTYYSHFLEGETMRSIFEPFFRNAKHGQKPVDLVYHGHVHAYERFDNIYQYRKDPCGPVYVTIGDGGNREGVEAVTGIARFNDPQANSTYPPVFNIKQPSISLYREYTYGHGTLDVINRTTALWTWYRNTEQALPYGADSVYITSHAVLDTCHKYPNGTHPEYTLPFADGGSNSWYPTEREDDNAIRPEAFATIGADQGEME